MSLLEKCKFYFSKHYVNLHVIDVDVRQQRSWVDITYQHEGTMGTMETTTATLLYSTINNYWLRHSQNPYLGIGVV